MSEIGSTGGESPSKSDAVTPPSVRRSLPVMMRARGAMRSAPRFQLRLGLPPALMTFPLERSLFVGDPTAGEGPA